MRKVYSFLALVAMFVMGAVGAQAQVYYDVVGFGDTDAAVSEFEVGGQYVLQTASTGEPDFFAGTEGKAKIAGENCVFTFVEAGEVDGIMTYYLQQVSTGLYMADRSVSFVDTKARAFRFWACHPTESLSKDDGEEPSDPDAFRSISVYDQATYGGPVNEATAWIFTDVNSTASSYTYFAAYWRGYTASFWSYRDTNTWYVYKVNKMAGYSLLEALVQDKFPEGTVDGIVTAGNAVGECPAEKVEVLRQALEAATDALNGPTLSDAEYDALAKRLFEAYEDCMNSRVAIKEGYFLFNCPGRQENAHMYETANHTLYCSTFDAPQAADEWTLANAAYIFKLEAAEGGFYLRNFVSERYFGSVATSTTVQTTVDPTVVYHFIDSPATPGAYAIGPTTVTSTSTRQWLHQAGGNEVVGWEAGAGASVWNVIAVSDEVIEALTPLVEQYRLNAELSDLYNDAVDAYAGAFRYETEATKDGFYDDLGMVNAIWSNASDSSEGTDKGANLLDADVTTFWHSDWHNVGTTDGGEFHNLEVELTEALETFAIKYTARPQNKNAAPLKFHVYGTNELTVSEDEDPVWTSDSWVDQGTLALSYDYPAEVDGSEKANWVGIATMKMDAAYKYLRFDAVSVTGNSKFFNLSEFHVYPATLDADNSVITTIPEDVTNELLRQTEAAKNELADEAATKETVDALQKAYDEFLAYYPDPSVLAALIEQAKAQAEAAEEGSQPGYFQAGAADALQAAITSVEGQVLNDEGEMKDLLTVAQLNAAQKELETALDAFFAKLVKPTDGAYYRIRSGSSGAAGGNYVYSAGNGETTILWGGASDENRAGDLRYIWKVVVLEDGTFAFQNMFSGNYMGRNEELYSKNIAMSYEPMGVTLESAQVAGFFNLRQGYDNTNKAAVYANTDPRGLLVTWSSHSGNDNSSFEFIPEENDAWLGSQVINISDDYAHILTVPFEVVDAGDDPLYAVKGLRDVEDGKVLELVETDHIDAGVPFIVVRPAGATSINLYPASYSLETLEWVTEGKTVNGLVGVLNGDTVNEDVWVLYNNLVVRGSKTEEIPANGGYFNPNELPTVTEAGAYSIPVDDALVGVGSITLRPATNGAVYDLSGRRVLKAQKGFYIINGKKVIK
ncbi:MAG: hypothetical protein IJ659_07700 [Alloprevotella sp.]|nr:hypothetical protein [Alloprevotella sp.]